MVENLYTFKNQLEGENIIFCYHGAMVKGMIPEIEETFKNQTELKEESLATRIKGFSIFVELAQNILQESKAKLPVIAMKDKEMSGGIILLGRQEDKYFIHCGDLIDMKAIKHIEDTLLRIKKMDRDELKTYYRDQRKKPLDTYNQKVEFAVIEMACRSKDISFSSTPVDDQYSFFSIKVFF